MPVLTVTQDFPGSVDGYTTELFKAGETIKVPETTAEAFIATGCCELKKGATKPEPEKNPEPEEKQKTKKQKVKK